jgi:ribosomal protein S18 acetylase RimI-like enzyme
MAITERSYTSQTDLDLMFGLANQFAADNLHVTDLPYRFSSWALDHTENAHLWFDENGQLAAWAVLQTPWWTIDYACRPAETAQLHCEILDWANLRAKAVAGSEYGRPAWYVNVFTGQTQRICDLEAAGFRCQSDAGEDSWSKVLMRRAGEVPVRVYPPPVGFTVRPLDGEKEVGAYVELQRAVFESKTMTEAWRLRTLRHPAYRPELDLVVATPDSKLASFCIAWVSRSPDGALVGQIEPLGCHKDYRRFALGRVALAEGLRRLQAIGVNHILVETDNYRNTAMRLYEFFDFKVLHDVLVYRKDYPSE